MKIIPQHGFMKKINNILKLSGVYLASVAGGLIAIYSLLNLADQAISTYEHTMQNIQKHRTYPINSHDSAYAWMEERVIINF